MRLMRADRFYKDISQPVLVVGAGQGLVVGHLRDKGIDVRGVDLDDRMIALAKKRSNSASLLPQTTIQCPKLTQTWKILSQKISYDKSNCVNAAYAHCR